jgi:MFS transporter, FHS family, glucose/mannose:H+ symporter
MNLLLVTVVVGLLVAGMGAALLGSVKVPLARRLAIDESRVGGLVAVFGFVMIPVVLMFGVLTDLLGKRAVLVLGSLLIAAALAVLARSKNYWQALVSVVLLSAGWAGLINVLNVLMPAAFPGSHVYATNLGNTFFGLGAFLAPLVVMLLLRRLGFTPGSLVLAAVALAPAVLALGADFSLGGGKDAVQSAVSEAVPFWGNSVMWLCVVAAFFYLPLEATMAAWFTTYLVDNRVSEGTASALLSAFWLAFAVSRLAVAFNVFGLPAGSEAAVILVAALVGAAILSGVVFGHGPRLSGACVVAAGLAFGPVFPTLMAILLSNCEPATHGRAVGLFFALGGLGWTTIPVLIGACARRASVQKAFGIAVGAAIGLAGIAFVLMAR